MRFDVYYVLFENYLSIYRIDEAGEKRTLLFFWTRTDEIFKVMKKIEQQFWKIFNEMKPHQNTFIDENSNVWHGEMKK